MRAAMKAAVIERPGRQVHANENPTARVQPAAVPGVPSRPVGYKRSKGAPSRRHATSDITLERVGRAAGGGAEGAMGAADGAREAAVVAGGVRGEVGAAGGARAVAVLVAAMGRVASRC